VGDTLTVTTGGAAITGAVTADSVTADSIIVGSGVAVGPGWGLSSNAFFDISANVTVDMSLHNGKILSVTGSGMAIDIEFDSSQAGLVDILVVGDFVGDDLTLSCSTSTMLGAVVNALDGSAMAITLKERLNISEPKAGSMLRMIVDGAGCYISGNSLGAVSST
jgi:hypothetical protein